MPNQADEILRQSRIHNLFELNSCNRYFEVVDGVERRIISVDERNREFIVAELELDMIARTYNRTVSVMTQSHLDAIDRRLYLVIRGVEFKVDPDARLDELIVGPNEPSGGFRDHISYLRHVATACTREDDSLLDLILAAKARADRASQLYCYGPSAVVNPTQYEMRAYCIPQVLEVVSRCSPPAQLGDDLDSNNFLSTAFLGEQFMPQLPSRSAPTPDFVEVLHTINKRPRIPARTSVSLTIKRPRIRRHYSVSAVPISSPSSDSMLFKTFSLANVTFMSLHLIAISTVLVKMYSPVLLPYVTNFPKKVRHAFSSHILTNLRSLHKWIVQRTGSDRRS